MRVKIHERTFCLTMCSAASVMSDSVALWTAAHQAPLSLGFSRQEYWAGLPFPSPGDLPHPGIEPVSPALAGIFFTTQPPGKPWEVCRQPYYEVCEVEVIRSVCVCV